MIWISYAETLSRWYSASINISHKKTRKEKNAKRKRMKLCRAQLSKVMNSVLLLAIAIVHVFVKMHHPGAYNIVTVFGNHGSLYMHVASDNDQAFNHKRPGLSW
jgi:L-asparagine transporter-like permease